jgi:hypothetical protein
MIAESLGPPDVRALFQQRVAGDDALLRLANLRFRQVGMPAEVYADNPDHLEHLLGFVPEHRTLPVVHLNRSANLLDASGRSLVEAFASRFTGRVAGLVVHDKGDMVDRLPEVVTALRELGTPRAGRPMVYLEFATGLPVDRFVELARRIADVELASMCIDIGHVGIQQAKRSLIERSCAGPATPGGPPSPRSCAGPATPGGPPSPSCSAGSSASMLCNPNSRCVPGRPRPPTRTVAHCGR